MPSKILITGTSRGIGLQLARLALAEGHELAAVARRPEGSGALLELQRAYGARLRLLPFDLRDPAAATATAAAIADWDCLDVLVNNAGVLRSATTREDFMESFLVNAVAPYELTSALLPVLQQSRRPRVLHVTSRMGSIADNASGGYAAYRASKAALNMINKGLQRDHPWLTAVVLHPGWVRTDMGGPEAPVSVEESAAGIWRVIGGLSAADSGKFYDYQGNGLPW